MLNEKWTGSNGQELKFEPVDSANANGLSAEVIPVRGRWDNNGLDPSVYLLRSRVHSPSIRQVRLLRDTSTVPAVWLNGNSAGDTCSLRAGDNQLLIAYEPPADQRFSPEHAGPMSRIADIESGKRLENIRYQP